MHFDPQTHCSQKQPLLLQGSQISPASCLIFWGYFRKTSSSYLFVKETDHKVCQKGVFKTTNLGNLEDHSNLLLQHWACVCGGGDIAFPTPIPPVPFMYPLSAYFGCKWLESWLFHYRRYHAYTQAGWKLTLYSTVYFQQLPCLANRILLVPYQNRQPLDLPWNIFRWVQKSQCLVIKYLSISEI